MAYVTSSPVAAGGELLTTYATGFWLGADRAPDLDAAPAAVAAAGDLLDARLAQVAGDLV